MTTKKWNFVNKSNWKKGPWDREPDKLQWIDEETGLPCLIVRDASGALGGYIGVFQGHPFFQKHHQVVPIWVHGGLKYSDFCQTEDEHGISYISDAGRRERFWWFGFTCTQLEDCCPASGSACGKYRDVAFVQQEIQDMAQQIKKLSQRKMTTLAASTLSKAVSDLGDVYVPMLN